jgi:hypothetical protein
MLSMARPCHVSWSELYPTGYTDQQGLGLASVVLTADNIGAEEPAFVNMVDPSYRDAIHWKRRHDGNGVARYANWTKFCVIRSEWSRILDGCRFFHRMYARRFEPTLAPFNQLVFIGSCAASFLMYVARRRSSPLANGALPAWINGLVAATLGVPDLAELMRTVHWHDEPAELESTLFDFGVAELQFLGWEGRMECPATKRLVVEMCAALLGRLTPPETSAARELEALAIDLDELWQFATWRAGLCHYFHVWRCFISGLLYLLPDELTGLPKEGGAGVVRSAVVYGRFLADRDRFIAVLGREQMAAAAYDRVLGTHFAATLANVLPSSDQIEDALSRARPEVVGLLGEHRGRDFVERWIALGQLRRTTDSFVQTCHRSAFRCLGWSEPDYVQESLDTLVTSSVVKEHRLRTIREFCGIDVLAGTMLGSSLEG